MLPDPPGIPGFILGISIKAIIVIVEKWKEKSPPPPHTHTLDRTLPEHAQRLWKKAQKFTTWAIPSLSVELGCLYCWCMCIYNCFQLTHEMLCLIIVHKVHGITYNNYTITMQACYSMGP